MDKSEILEAQPIKPGVKTTEFWLVALFTLLSNLGPMAQEIGGQWGAIANAVVIGLYALSLGKAKQLGVAIPLLLLGCFAMFALPACTVTIGPDGKPRVDVDPVGVARAASQLSDRIKEPVITPTK